MPGLASNTRPGLVQGNPAGAGNVSVNADDGRMAVNGWAELITRIGNSEATIGLNSQGQPTTPPAGMRSDIQALQNNKVDKINRAAENNLVTVNVNEQGQVTGGAPSITTSVISDFNMAADSRADNRIIAQNAAGGLTRTMVDSVVPGIISSSTIMAWMVRTNIGFSLHDILNSTNAIGRMQINNPQLANNMIHLPGSPWFFFRTFTSPQSADIRFNISGSDSVWNVIWFGSSQNGSTSGSSHNVSNFSVAPPAINNNSWSGIIVGMKVIM